MSKPVILHEFSVDNRSPMSLINQLLNGCRVSHVERGVAYEMLLTHCENAVSTRLQGSKHVSKAAGRQKACSKSFGTCEKVKSSSVCFWHSLSANNERLDVFIAFLEEHLLLGLRSLLAVDFGKSLLAEHLANLTFSSA